MTLTEMRISTALFITPAQAAGVLRCDPHSIRVQAHTAPEALGFPVCVIGSRVRIPRIPFLRYVEGGAAQ